MSISADAPASAATRPWPYGGSGTRWATTTARGRPEAASEHSDAGCSPAEASSHRQHLPGDGRRHGSPAASPPRSASTVAVITIWAGGRGVPTDQLDAGQLALRRAPPRRSRSAHSTGVDAGAARLTTRPTGTAPIASASATQDATALRPDVLCARPVAAEVHVLDHGVGRHGEIAGQPQHRAVVTDPEPYRHPTPPRPAVTRSIRANSPSSPIVCPARPAGFEGEP